MTIIDWQEIPIHVACYEGDIVDLDWTIKSRLSCFLSPLGKDGKFVVDLSTGFLTTPYFFKNIGDIQKSIMNLFYSYKTVADDVWKEWIPKQLLLLFRIDNEWKLWKTLNINCESEMPVMSIL